MATASPEVKLHRKSVLLTACFFVNLLFMPLKCYLSEVTPFTSDDSYEYVNVGQQRFVASEFAQYLPLLYNATTIDPTVVYFYDSQYGVDVMRTVLNDEAANAAETLSPVYDILGVPYFPPDLKRIWPSVLGNHSVPCTVISWDITILTARASSSALWWVPGDDMSTTAPSSTTASSVSTVYYVYRPVVKILLWRLSKFLYRMGLVVWIFVLATKHYYRHVLHLYKSLQQAPLHANSHAARYEVVVGEPTCLVLSNPWLCVAFVMDICASTEYVGQACLRVCQTENWYYFGLGLFYLGRTVWCAYTTLTLVNLVLKRFDKASWFKPANTTILAIVATCAGGGIVTIQKQWPQVLDMYTALFLPYRTSLDQAELDRITHMDIALIMIVYLSTMGILPFALAGCLRFWNVFKNSDASPKVKKKGSFLTILIAANRQHSSSNSTLRRAGSSEFAVEPPKHSRESGVHYNDFKHRIILWLCRLGKVKKEICTGGSVYPFFDKFPDFQTQCTISQRGGDCYVLSYDKHDRLMEVTRVTLASQIDCRKRRRPFRLLEFATTTAVGRLVATKKGNVFQTAMLHRGLADSPWVA